jgi:hypothetical protein
MSRFPRIVGLLFGLVAGLAPALQAQVTGLPVQNNGVASGLTVGGEVGFPNQDYGKGTAFGGRAALGLGPLGVSAVLSRWDPKGPAGAQTGYGLAANLKVFGGPLVPFSVTAQAGAERASVSGNAIWHFPLGLGIAVKIPNPALAIKPWIAPRVDLVRTEVGSATNTDTNFGISGGLEFSLLGGFGFGAAYDRVFVGNGVNPSVVSFDAHYTIKIPGL